VSPAVRLGSEKKESYGVDGADAYGSSKRECHRLSGLHNASSCDMQKYRRQSAARRMTGKNPRILKAGPARGAFCLATVT
jgi:hypothetical protein